MIFHSYEPKDGHQLKHDPFNAIIGPRPIGWISTINDKGISNLAPYSFFSAFNYVPPIIGFSSVGRKDTLRNIEENGEFVWNLVTIDLLELMNKSSASFSRDISEFDANQIEKTSSTLVKPYRVAKAKVAFECKCTEIIQLKSARGELAQAWMIFAEVVQIHIDKSLLIQGVYETSKAGHVLRGGGLADYFKISDNQLIKLFRPE